jgi:hypothetical protein
VKLVVEVNENCGRAKLIEIVIFLIANMLYYRKILLSTF